MPRRRASRLPSPGSSFGPRLHWAHHRLGARPIRPRSLLAEAVSLLLVILLPPLVEWHLLAPSSDRAYIPPGDFYSQYLPLYHLVRESVTAGQIALWNPFFHAGLPGLGDPQMSAAYPPLLLWSWIAPGSMPDDRWLTYYVVGCLSLAAVVVFGAARSLGVTRPGAIVAAMGFSLGGFLTSYPMQQVTILQSSTWVVPCIVAAIGIGRSARDDRPVAALGWAGVGGAALGLMALGGHPQVLVYGGYAALAVALWMLIGSAVDRVGEPPGDRLIAVARTGSAYAVMLTLGVLIGAVQLAPAMEFAAVSTRTALGFDATSVGLTPLDWLTILLPGSITQHSPLFVGVVSLSLAMTAVLGHRGGRHTALLLIVAVLALLVTLGRASFVEPALYAFAPGFALFRDHERSALVWSGTVCLLAGIGASALWHAETDEKLAWRLPVRATGVLAIVGAALTLLFLVARSVASGPQGDHVAMMLNRSVWLLLITLLALTAFWLGSTSGRRHIAMSIVTGVLFLELSSSAWAAPTAPRNPSDAYRADSAIAFLKAQTGPFRVRNADAWPPNYGAIHGIEDIGGDNPLQARTIHDLVETRQEWRIWQLLDVRYVASRKAIDDKGVELAFSGDGVNVYQMQYPLGRAWLVDRYEVIGDDATALARVAAPDFDPERQVVLDQPPSFASANAPAQPTPLRTAPATETSAGRLSIDVAGDRPSILVVSEVGLPGWVAEVDGVRAPVLRANAATLGIEVPAGQHRVTVSYEPNSARIGAFATVAGVLGLLVTTALWLRQGLRRAP